MGRKRKAEEAEAVGSKRKTAGTAAAKPKPTAAAARAGHAAASTGKRASGTVAKAQPNAAGAGKKQAKEKPEKRGAIYRKKPSQDTLDRMDRALPNSGHRMFLIERKMLRSLGHASGPAEEYAVLGATGNVYKVVIDRSPTCTCPDFQLRRTVCKHQLFVTLRVLRIAQDNPVVWQRGLLTSEVQQMLGGQLSQRAAPGVAGDVQADRALVQQYKQATGKAKAGAEPAETVQRPLEGAECGICFDDLHACDAPLVVFCQSCGNNVHASCFSRWRASQGSSVTCVYCRAPWKDAAGARAGPSGEGYLNLASHSAAHAGADTSLGALYPGSWMWLEAREGTMPMGEAMYYAGYHPTRRS